MIGALSQAVGSQSDMRGAGDPRSGQETGKLFAQLLGAGGGDIPDVFVDEGLAAIAMLVPQSAVDRSPDQGEAVSAPLARMFNQDGFFGHALADLVAEQAAAAKLGVAIDTLPGAGGPGALEPVAVSVTELKTLAARTGSAVAGAESVLRAPAGSKGVAPAAFPVSGQSAVAPLAVEGEGEAPEVHPLPRSFRGVLAAQSPVHVAIAEVEQGLHITAHVAGLDETGRRQLREAISALLARHGLTNVRIRIQAMPFRGNER